MATPNKDTALLQQQIEELRLTLIEAIEEVIVHNEREDYFTSKQILKRWKRLTGMA